MMFQLIEIIQLQHLIYYDQVVSVVEKSAVGGHPLDSLDMSKSSYKFDNLCCHSQVFCYTGHLDVVRL